MNLTFTSLFIFIFIFIFITTQTMWLHPKPKSNILHQEFSIHKDLWVKKKGNENLLILLHGMYSSPQVFQEAAEIFSLEGWDIYAPALPNASTSFMEVASQQSYQWEDSLKVSLHRSMIYNQNYKKIVLGGHSQGGSLALTIAPSLPFLSGLIIVAAPLALINSKTSLFRKIGLAFSGFLYFIMPKKGIFLNNKNAKEKSLVEGYYNEKEFFFALTLHSMRLALKKTKNNLNRIIPSTLLIYEKGDRTTDFNDTILLTEKIPNSTLISLETPLSLEPYSGRHKLFSYIHTKDIVIKEISKFLKQISSH